MHVVKKLGVSFTTSQRRVTINKRLVFFLSLFLTHTRTRIHTSYVYYTIHFYYFIRSFSCYHFMLKILPESLALILPHSYIYMYVYMFSSHYRLMFLSRFFASSSLSFLILITIVVHRSLPFSLSFLWVLISQSRG